MNPEKWDKVKEIFAAAIDLPPGERSAFIANASGGNAEIESEVESLLSASDDSVGALPSNLAPKPTVTDDTGKTIGHYRLLKLIGEGGFGTVYLAGQTTPVVRQVALKIIKLGMDTRQVIARFEAERQALAILDHPNIARVIDAGATDTGRPYFVMELVDGVPITDYCDQHNLTIAQRLEMLIPVCRAIQHAHQKGIIHRDLKPSNVLVSEHDGQPVPKVIDFGIAKAINQRLTEKTVFTEQNQMIGTPQYMSPEQAEAGVLDIDTRTDIYSLGVLLYELLVGVTPFDEERLRSAAFFEIQRIIAKDEPQKPSTRVSQLEALPSIAATRQINPARLTQTIRGELDWIVMKCLEKDRSRRYDSASALIEDIDRHLSNRPVNAGPPSRSYRVRKFVRRNRAGVLAAMLLVTVVLAGSAVSIWQAVRATRAEKQAKLDAIRADRESETARREVAKQVAVNGFINEMLGSADPSKLTADDRSKGRDVTVIRALNDASKKLDAVALKSQPSVAAAIRRTIGGTYMSLASYPSAERELRIALELERSLSSSSTDLATSLSAVGQVQLYQGKFPEARQLLEESLSIREGLLGSEHEEVAATLRILGVVLYQTGDLAGAETAFTRALAINTRRFGEDSKLVAAGQSDLGTLFRANKKIADSEQQYRKALEIYRRTLGPDHPDIATTLSNLSTVVSATADRDERGDLLREALQMQRRLYAGDHINIATTLTNLAAGERELGHLDATMEHRRDALAMVRRLTEPEHPLVAAYSYNLAILLTELKQYEEAAMLLDDALAIRRKLFGEDNLEVASTIFAIARLKAFQGDLAVSEKLLREALEIHQKSPVAGQTGAAKVMTNLAVLLRERNEFTEAEKLSRDALEISRRVYGNDHLEVAIDLYGLGVLMNLQERYAESADFHRAAMEIRNRRLPPNHPLRGKSMCALGEALETLARFDEAEPLLLGGFEIVRTGRVRNDTRNALLRLVNLYGRWNKPEQLQQWQQALADFDLAHPPATQPETKPTTVPSTVPTTQP